MRKSTEKKSSNKVGFLFTTWIVTKASLATVFATTVSCSMPPNDNANQDAISTHLSATLRCCLQERGVCLLSRIQLLSEQSF